MINFKTTLILTNQSSENSRHTGNHIQFCHVCQKRTNDWYLNLESGKYAATTFYRSQKAFDTVNHDTLQ